MITTDMIIMFLLVVIMLLELWSFYIITAINKLTIKRLHHILKKMKLLSQDSSSNQKSSILRFGF